MIERARRGDGIGIELTRAGMRAVRLDRGRPEQIDAIAEVPFSATSSFRAPAASAAPSSPSPHGADGAPSLEAFERLRAELGDSPAPTRIATFPPGSCLQRLDTTGWSGAELNRRRAELHEGAGIDSTMLLDDGPRRWMVTLAWDVTWLSTIEHLAEQAGFADVAIEPSPVAVCRVVGADATWIARSAALGEGFRLVAAGAVPVAAVSVDPSSAVPELELRVAAVSRDLFDDVTDAAELAATFARLAGRPIVRQAPLTGAVFAGGPYPPFPSDDRRSLARLGVALGAAVGAAGLSGRVRPVDVVTPPSPEAGWDGRPWAIEEIDEEPGRRGAPRRRRLRRSGPAI